MNLNMIRITWKSQGI